MEPVKGFGKRLTELMDDNGLTPVALGEAVGISPYSIYHWKAGKGKYMPSISTLVTLADHFECSLDYLLGVSEDNGFAEFNKNLPPFSERFPAVVDACGENYYKLSKRAGFSSTKVFYDWEHGLKSPRIDSILALAAALDCSTDYILGRTDYR